jgi:hypothetical protein
MILFFNNQPVTESVKIQNFLQIAQELYGSDYFDLQNQYWFGDNLTVQALFPTWIMRAYEETPSNVLVIPIVKNYFRWLLSLEYGYGAQLNWENLRTPLFVNSLFLEAYADFYFPNADFSQEPLKSILPNLRKFLINSDSDYNNQKGTPQGIKYLICNLLGLDWKDVEVYTANSCVIQVNVASQYQTTIKNYKAFLEEHVLPAGMSVIYGVK